MMVSAPPILAANATPRNSEVPKRAAAARLASSAAAPRARAASATASGSMVAVVAKLLTNALITAVASITAVNTRSGDVPARRTSHEAKREDMAVRSSANASNAPPPNRKITSFANGAAISAGVPIPRTPSATSGISPVTAGSTASVTHQVAIRASSANTQVASGARPKLGPANQATAASTGPTTNPSRATNGDPVSSSPASSSSCDCVGCAIGGKGSAPGWGRKFTKSSMRRLAPQQIHNNLVLLPSPNDPSPKESVRVDQPPLRATRFRYRRHSHCMRPCRSTRAV